MLSNIAAYIISILNHANVFVTIEIRLSLISYDFLYAEGYVIVTR